MFALAAFRGALPLTSARSFPPPHSHALMRALAFSLHLSSPLSPTRSGSRLCCARPSTLLHIVLLVSAAGTVLSSSHLHHLHFSPSNLIFLTSFKPSLCRPLSISHTPFLPSFSRRPTLHTCFFGPHSPLLFLSTTCLCS